MPSASAGSRRSQESVAAAEAACIDRCAGRGPGAETASPEREAPFPWDPNGRGATSDQNDADSLPGMRGRDRKRPRHPVLVTGRAHVRLDGPDHLLLGDGPTAGIQSAETVVDQVHQRRHLMRFGGPGPDEARDHVGERLEYSAVLCHDGLLGSHGPPKIRIAGSMPRRSSPDEVRTNTDAHARRRVRIMRCALDAEGDVLHHDGESGDPQT
jgi:hypothetical protein